MLKMLKSKDITNRFLTKVKDIEYCFLSKIKEMSVHVSYPKSPLTSRTTEGSDNFFNFPQTSLLCQSLNSVGLMPNCFLKQAEK